MNETQPSAFVSDTDYGKNGRTVLNHLACLLSLLQSISVTFCPHFKNALGKLKGREERKIGLILASFAGLYSTMGIFK